MGAKPAAGKELFYGDNLPSLRDNITRESIELVYLGSPFNSSRSYGHRLGR